MHNSGDTVYITVTVTDPVAGAAVHVALETANGKNLAGNNTTNGSGVAGFTYKVNPKKDGEGTYSVVATASKDGFESGSGSTTFEVTK